jgi:hypothetical protein
MSGVDFLQAPNLENLKSRTRISLVELCKKNQLRSSGTKELLLNRLLDYFGYSEEASLQVNGHIYINSEEMVYEPRPEGKLFQIGSENSATLSAILGLSTSPDGNVFEKFTRMTMDIDSMDCYEVPGIKISKRVCNFCRLKTSCDTKELDFNKNHLQLEIKLKSDDKERESLEFDKRKLQDYFSAYKFVVNYNQGDTDSKSGDSKNRLIFSKKTDPFKPGFGENSSRRLSLTLLNYTSSTSKKDTTWSHLFYSNILGRTLTFFEAMLINSMNSKTTDVSGTSPFPSIQEIYKFFTDTLKINLESSEPDIRRILKKVFTTKLEVIMNEESKLFIEDLLNNTRRFFELGLYDTPTELFMHYKEKNSFDRHVINFLIEIVTSLQVNRFPKGELFLDKRLDAIIFSNRSDLNTLHLLPPYRIIRVVNDIQLDHSWVLIDGGIPHVDFSQKKREIKNEVKTVKTKMNRVISMLKKNVKHSKDFLFQYWNESISVDANEHHEKNPQKRRFVSVFSNYDIFEAYAMHEFLINLKLNHGDMSFAENTEYFNTFFERMFMFKFDGRLYKDPDIVKNLKERLHQPRSKNLLPLVRLIRLSNQFPDIIEMIEDPDGTDRTRKENTTQFKFTSNYSINSKKETTMICIRRVKILNSHETYWKLHETDGKEIFGQKKTLRGFFKSLNYNPQTVTSSSIPDVGLFLTNGVHNLFDQFAMKKSFQVFNKLGTVLNSYSSEGVLCLCTPGELDAVIGLMGQMKTREINFDGNLVYAWQPPLATRVSSQNVRFTGRGL